MLGKVEEKMEERAMVQFMSRFTDHPFLLKFRENEYRIGEGEPAFTVHLKEPIPVADLMNSTSIALGEAYMDGKLNVEGDLYEALDNFLGQMGKFSTDQTALKKLIYTSKKK